MKRSKHFFKFGIKSPAKEESFDEGTSVDGIGNFKRTSSIRKSRGTFKFPNNIPVGSIIDATQVSAGSQLNQSSSCQPCEGPDIKRDYKTPGLRTSNSTKRSSTHTPTNREGAVETSAHKNLVFARTILKNLSRKMMIELLDDNQLLVRDETVVCKILINWMQCTSESLDNRDIFLHHIRWSAVTESYFRSTFLENPLFTEYENSRGILKKISLFFRHGIHFRELNTHLRPSVGVEMILFAVISQEGNPKEQTFIIPLQEPQSIVKCISNMPTQYRDESYACVRNNTVYVCGMGVGSTEIWKYESGMWSRCGKLNTGRRRHGMAFIDDTLYICGGYSDSLESVLDDIEKFDFNTNVSVTSDVSLNIAVDSAACVAHEKCIYMFGGVDCNGEVLCDVQVYNTMFNECTILATPMPHHCRCLKAVLWENYAIMLGKYISLIYEFGDGSWMVRKRFKTDNHYFATFIENHKIFIAGGGSQNGENEWIYDGEIRFTEVENIISDNQMEWRVYSTLPTPGFIHVFGILSSKQKQKQTQHGECHEWPGIVQSPNVLSLLAEDSIIRIIEDSDPPMKTEQDLCSWILDWCHARSDAKKDLKLLEILSFIDWSAVTKDFIQSKFKSNPLFDNESSKSFLSKVLRYKQFNVHYKGLRTFHRPSTMQEKCLVIVGVDNDSLVTSDTYRVSLQRSKDFTSKLQFEKLQSAPTEINQESVGIVMQNILYVIGIGGRNREIWKYDTNTGWRKCTDMIQGRRRHCVAFLDETIYIFGGFDEQVVLDDIEAYDFKKDEICEIKAKLSSPVESSVCAAFKKKVFLFGGYNRSGVAIDIVQVFDSETETCSILAERMPRPHRALRLSLWENFAILVGRHSCFLYDFETYEWAERERYKTCVNYFASFIENQNLYIAGGETGELGCMDVIKYTSVINIINNEEDVGWTQVSSLPFSSSIHAFGVMTFPTTAPIFSRGKGKRDTFRSSERTHSLEYTEDSRRRVNIPTCSICRDKFKDPRILPNCGHTYCLCCLENLARGDGLPSTTLRCPLCNRTTAVPDQGVEMLPKNFSLMSLLPEKCEKANALESEFITESNKQEEQKENNYHFEMAHINRLKMTYGNRVTGVTLLGNRVYVICDFCKYIEIFEKDKFESLPHLYFNELILPKDIASYKSGSDFIFVIDSHKSTNCVWRIDVSRKHISKWLKGVSDPLTLASTSDGKMLMLRQRAYNSERFDLDVYGMEGTRAELVQSVELQTEIKCPRHALQKSSGNYVICYGTGHLKEDAHWSIWNVCEISRNGDILRKLAVQAIAGPLYYMAINKCDEVFVSDGTRKEVFAVDPDLKSAFAIDHSSSTCTSKWEPWKLCFSKENKLLIVGHSSNSLDALQDIN